MAKAKKQTGSNQLGCPTCRAEYLAKHEGAKTWPHTHLRLDAKNDLYVCQQGHTLTADQLLAALGTAPKPVALGAVPTDAKPTVADQISDPEIGLNPAPESTPESGSGDAVLGLVLVPEVKPSRADSAQELSQIEDETGDFQASISPAESSETPDDVRIPFQVVEQLHLPNGDLAVFVSIPESLVGPVQELSAEMKQSVKEWLDGNIELYLNDLFQRR